MKENTLKICWGQIDTLFTIAFVIDCHPGYCIIVHKIELICCNMQNLEEYGIQKLNIHPKQL